MPQPLTAEEFPSWLIKHALFFSARRAHQLSAARMREKLNLGSSTSELFAEADNRVRREIGPYPSADPPEWFTDPGEAEQLERDMREVACSYFDELAQTESFVWGLGVAGLFHQWERATRMTLQQLLPNASSDSKLASANFDRILKRVAVTGFAVERSRCFPALRLAWLIANTVKHGHGRAFSKLIQERPDLLQGGPVGVRIGNLPPQPDYLRFGLLQFDETVQAINDFWSDYENDARLD